MSRNLRKRKLFTAYYTVINSSIRCTADYLSWNGCQFAMECIVFLRINGWRWRRAPMQIYAEMIQMFESGTVDIAQLELWLDYFTVATE
ncbi:hypothetical protein [Acidithiobacillus concretivorus]|uniref:hypothetical protein n=1 Tax=Acidithiobacillus concretivorus TaxID=3063952 RepID=UPI001C075CDE|nr:hypothetical protein [Acidithiobacillus concretivorus]